MIVSCDGSMVTERTTGVTVTATVADADSLPLVTVTLTVVDPPDTAVIVALVALPATVAMVGASLAQLAVAPDGVTAALMVVVAPMPRRVTELLAMDTVGLSPGPLALSALQAAMSATAAARPAPATVGNFGMPYYAAKPDQRDHVREQ